MKTLLQYLADLAKDPVAQEAFKKDPETAIANSDLSDADKQILHTRNNAVIQATVGRQAVEAMIYATPAPMIYAAPMIYGHPQMIYAPMIYGMPQMIYAAPMIYGHPPMIYGHNPAMIYGQPPMIYQPQMIYAPGSAGAAPPMIYAPNTTKPDDTK